MSNNKIILLFLIILICCISFIYVIYKKKIPIYIVSMTEKRPERTSKILSKIKDSNNYYIAYIGAIDGKKRFNETKETFSTIERPGEAGCFLSHLHMWNLFINTNNNYGLILEDDADIYLPKQWYIIETALAYTPTDWDIIWIGSTKIINKEKNIAINNIIDKNNSTLWGTHAYLISKKCANYLVKSYYNTLLYTELKQFDHIKPVDLLLSENLKLKQYILRHNIIQQVQEQSDTHL